MTIHEVDALELGELLGSLLESIVAAQERSARATIDFVDAVGLIETTDADGTKSTKLRTVSMRYRKKDAQGDTSEFEVEVPLLSLVNPPSLAVSEATLKFSYEVIRTESDDGKGMTTPSTTGASAKPVRMRGVIRSAPTGSTVTQARSSFAVDVNVVVKQQLMPVGLERLLNLAELGIEERVPELPPGSTHVTGLDHLDRSLEGTRLALVHLRDGLRDGGFADAVSTYRKMADVVASQRLVSAASGDPRFESQFAEVIAAAGAVRDLLVPWVAVLDRLADLDRMTGEVISPRAETQPVAHLAADDGPEHVLLAWLAAHPGAHSASRIAAGTDLGSQVVRPLLTALQSAGRVRSEPSGNQTRWRFAESRG